MYKRQGIGTPFLLTTDAADGTWDMWFPGQSGCYFVNVNTVKRQWNALLIPQLEVSGIDGITMEYKRAEDVYKRQIFILICPICAFT